MKKWKQLKITLEEDLLNKLSKNVNTLSSSRSCLEGVNEMALKKLVENTEDEPQRMTQFFVKESKKLTKGKETGLDVFY